MGPLLLYGLVVATLVPAPAHSEKDLHWILSLRRQRDHVFVSTADGLYRARLDKKQWQPLPAKMVPEPGGIFVPDRPDEKTLFYFVTPQSRRAAAFAGESDKAKNPQRPGFFRSTDLGDTWERLNHAYDFAEIVKLPGGRLFALAHTHPDKEQRYVVLVSDNGGRDWKDITNGVADYRLLSFIRDPDHPQRVCLYSPSLMRSGGEVLQAADENFRWKSVYASLRASYEWPPDRKKTEEEFFDHWYFVGYYVNWPAGTVERLPDEFPRETFVKQSGGISTSAMIYARLDNYFTLPFRTAKGISGFDILPEKAAYEFGSEQPFSVNVALTYYQDGTPRSLNPRIVDAKAARHFWSLKVSGPADEKKDLWPKDRKQPFDERKKGEKLTDLMKKHDGWQFLLTPDKPARRAIDLRELGMPDKPGIYRVQLRYTCSWRDDQQISRTLNTVTGQVFKVTIQAGGK